LSSDSNLLEDIPFSSDDRENDQNQSDQNFNNFNKFGRVQNIKTLKDDSDKKEMLRSRQPGYSQENDENKHFRDQNTGLNYELEDTYKRINDQDSDKRQISKDKENFDFDAKIYKRNDSKNKLFDTGNSIFKSDVRLTESDERDLNQYPSIYEKCKNDKEHDQIRKTEIENVINEPHNSQNSILYDRHHSSISEKSNSKTFVQPNSPSKSP